MSRGSGASIIGGQVYNSPQLSFTLHPPASAESISAEHKLMPKRIVLITGVTRGLGRAMAEEFARLGHTVLGCGRSKKEIDQLQRGFGKPHDFRVVDIASDDEIN